MPRLTRRRLIAGSVPLIGGAAAALHSAVPHAHPWGEAQAATDHGHGGNAKPGGHAGHTEGHANFRGGVKNDSDPNEIMRDYDRGKTTRLPNGRTLREWELVAGDQEIEVAPGVKFAARSYYNRIPG